MINLSLNFDGAEDAAHAKKVRELIGTHFGFPGSDKLKLDVILKDNGSSSVSFAGPKDIIAEAKRLWTENVEPTANKFKSQVNAAVRPVIAKAKATVKPVVKKANVKKTTVAVKKKAKAAAPKKKVVKATVKVSAAKKKKK